MTRIRFEDLPSTNTPRNAENLNKLNNVVISPTEPTTGEEVWIQKSKNLFDKNNANILHGYIISGTPTITDEPLGRTLYIPCDPNTKYTITKLASRFNVGYTTELPYIGCNIYSVMNGGSDLTEMTYETRTNAKYLVVFYHVTTITDPTEKEVLDSIQIEKGSVASSYEPYTTKKIYTKNDNGVYEEFYDENLFLKDNNLTSQKTNNVASSWQTIPFNKGHKNMIFIINGSDYQDIKIIPIALIKKFQPSSPLKIKINGNIIIQLAWSYETVVEYIWGGNYTVDHYTY